MRRHPLSDAAREYRSAMWLLAGIAVVAYAVGYAGVRGAVPRLVGLVGAECRRRHQPWSRSSSGSALTARALPTRKSPPSAP